MRTMGLLLLCVVLAASPGCGYFVSESEATPAAAPATAAAVAPAGQPAAPTVVHVPVTGVVPEKIPTPAPLEAPEGLKRAKALKYCVIFETCHVDGQTCRPMTAKYLVTDDVSVKIPMRLRGYWSTADEDATLLPLPERWDLWDGAEALQEKFGPKATGSRAEIAELRPGIMAERTGTYYFTLVEQDGEPVTIDSDAAIRHAQNRQPDVPTPFEDPEI